MSAPQGSAEWVLDRVGYVTASQFFSVLAKGQGKTRLAYLRRIVCERLTGKPSETKAYGAWASNLDRGTEQEKFARLEYEARTGNMVEEVGFIKHSTLMAGCSADGLVDTNGGLEIKSVIPSVQIETIERGGCPSEHLAQVFGCLWITGRGYWDFASYSPDMPENLRLYVFRVFRDEEYIAKLEAEVIVFLAEASAWEVKLRNTNQGE